LGPPFGWSKSPPENVGVTDPPSPASYADRRHNRERFLLLSEIITYTLSTGAPFTFQQEPKLSVCDPNLARHQWGTLAATLNLNTSLSHKSQTITPTHQYNPPHTAFGHPRTRPPLRHTLRRSRHPFWTRHTTRYTAAVRDAPRGIARVQTASLPQIIQNTEQLPSLSPAGFASLFLALHSKLQGKSLCFDIPMYSHFEKTSFTSDHDNSRRDQMQPDPMSPYPPRASFTTDCKFTSPSSSLG